MNTPREKYRQADSCETGAFEEDLLVMNTKTLDTVVLNPTAAALWKALKWPQSLKDLTDLLAEAYPQEKKETLKTRAAEVLEALLTQELLIRM